MNFCLVKVNPFFETSVKVEIEKNGRLTFSNGFINLSQLLPVFSEREKTCQTLTF